MSVVMARVGALLAVCLALSGCDRQKSSAPRPATSTSASHSAAASSSNKPPVQRASDALFARGTRLSGPLPIACSKDAANGCARLTVAVFGDVTTRSVDAVWVVDETSKEDVEIRPVPGIPKAIRLLDATSDKDAVLLVETLAAGFQPAGLRALLRLDEHARFNGPTPNGITGRPRARLLRLPLLRRAPLLPLCRKG